MATKFASVRVIPGQFGLLLLLVFAGNVLVASVAWIIVRLVTG
jgi:hypothetical protein